MKVNIQIIALLLLISSCGQAQTSRQDKFIRSKGDTIIIGFIDSLANNEGMPCGVVASASIYRINIEKCSNKQFTKGEKIYIYILCPKDFGDNYFQEGKLYRFSMSKNLKPIQRIIINNKRQFPTVKVLGWTDNIKLIHPE